MIKTSICLYPSDKGKIKSSFNFTKEYCRICLGVLKRDKHRINVFCGKNKIFQPQMELDHFTQNVFNLDFNEKINGMMYGIQSLISDQQNTDGKFTFNVGRLMIIADPKGMKIPDNPTNADLVDIAKNMLNYIGEKIRHQVKFDQLHFELIIFSKTSHDFHLDYNDSNELALIHVTVRHPTEAENYAQNLAADHLKLSFFKMKKFRIYFLDIFKQSNIDVTKVDYKNPEDLIGPVKVTYPCVILNKDIPVIKELQSNDIIFQDEWLLSLHNGYCFLSQIGPVLRTEKIKYFSFKADPTQKRLIQEIPTKLIISPFGDNWTFTRTKASPAINCLTRFNQFDDKSFVLFSPHFMNNQKARALIEPVLVAVAKSSPTNIDIDNCSKSFKDLFTVLITAPQDILQDVVMSEVVPTDQVTYAKLLHEKRMSLLMEIKTLLTWYENASEGHINILQLFMGYEKMIRQSSYTQQ